MAHASQPPVRDDADAGSASGAGPGAHGHRRGGRIARWVAGILLLLVVGVVGLVLVLSNTDWGREQLRQRVVAALAGTVHGRFQVGRISGNLLKGITLHDVAIADSSNNPFFRVDSMSTRYGLRSFVSKKIELSGVSLFRPVIVLDRRPGQPWNFARIFPSDSTTTDTSTAPGWGDWLVFRDVRLVDGRVTVRVPWAPSDSLTPAQQDSAVRVALDTASRANIVRVPGGFQNVQEYREMFARLPLVRLAHPDFPTRRIESDSLRLVALPFKPPAAVVRQARGAFELNGDSLWFRNVEAVLPASRATLTGRYDLNTGDLRIGGKAMPVTLADVRFILPMLPDGTATSDFAVSLADSAQGYRFDALDLKTGETTARGRVAIVLSDSAGTARVTFDSTALVFRALDTRLIERLAPAVEIPRHGILGGRLAADGSLAALRLDGDVTFDEPRTGRSRVLAAGEIGTENGVVRARGLKVQLAPVQVDLARLFVQDLPVSGTLTGSTTLEGSTDARLVATGLDLTHLDRGARSRLTGRATVSLGSGAPARAPAPPARTLAATPAPLRDDARRRAADGPRRAAPWFDVDVTARPLSLVTVGRFAPAAGLRGTASGPIRLTGTMDDLRVASALTLSDGGALSARGQLDLTGVIGYDMRVETLLFNANTVVAKAPRTSLSGQFAARGRGTDPATLTSVVSADITTSTLDTVAVDAARIRLRAAQGVLSVDTLSVRAPGTLADVVGTFGLTGNHSGALQYRVAVDSLPGIARYLPRDSGAVAPRPLIAAQRLARARADSAAKARRVEVAVAAGDSAPVPRVVVDTPTTIARDSLSGSVYAAGEIRGSIENFDLRGRAGVSRLVALGNQVERARVAYNWIGARTPGSALAVAAVADSVRAAGFALDSLDARATWRPDGVGRSSGTAMVALFQDIGRSYDLRADYGVFPDRREATFSQLRLRFDSTLWAATRPGAIRWGQPGIEVETLELTNGATGRLFVDGRLPTTGPADLTVAVRDFEIGDVLGLLQSDVTFTGRVSLDARLQGTAAAPLLRGEAMVAGARYRGADVPDVRATVNYADQRLTGDAAVTTSAVTGTRPVLTATGGVPINLALQGVTGPRLAENAPLTVDARLDSLPLDLASRFTDAVADVHGTASGTMAVRGTVRSPEPRGTVRLADAGFVLAATGTRLREALGVVQLRGDSVVVDSLVGYTLARRRGRVAIRGGIGIATPSQPSFDLQLVVDRARVLDSEQGRIDASAQIAVYGPFDRVFVSGGARVLGGVFYIPESDKKQVLSADDPAVFAVIDTTRLLENELVAAQSPLLENLRVDLFVGVDRDTWVRSREANVEVFSDGDLRVRVDRAKQAVVLDGIVVTERGQYTFLSKRFDVKRGSATFVGSQELDPNLQITAEYAVRQAAREPLVIRILIGGTVSEPRISLESDAQPPIAQTDLLSYLAFGSGSGSLLQVGGSSVSGGGGGDAIGATGRLATQQLTGVALGVLADASEARLGRSLGADVLNITPVPDLPPELFRADVSGLEAVLKGTQIEFGKYFNRQLFVGLQATPVFYQGDPPIPGFRIEYRFSGLPGYSLESAWQPRFFLPAPSLAPQNIDPQNALGVFFVRRWRF
ncbi:MAG: translocation/assembly module TamB domain-containing protein [Gemmatirosa sp.]